MYALPPDEFVAARDEAAKRARRAGDRRLAAEIGKLRRPTVGGWAVNLLVRERPDLVEELLELGEALRAAQRELRGDDLRELSVQRRAVLAGLTREVIKLARRDHRRDNLPAAEIEATFGAALADPAVADLVRAGRLTRTVTYAGFGETPRPRLRLVQGGGAAGEGEPDEAGVANAVESRAEGAAVAERRAERKAAERRAEEAAERRAEEAAAARRRAEEAAAQRRAEQAAAAERRRARVAANRELLAARTELAEAEAARVLAERSVTAARRRVEKARATVDRLEAEEPQA
ncbi:hypothetical protein HC030_01190 [Planosporangium mesophilum]|nr:hypothetical protein [Planosporangium mesophilum]